MPGYYISKLRSHFSMPLIFIQYHVRSSLTNSTVSVNKYVIYFLKADLEEMLGETRLSEDKAKKAMIDAARLADELRAEQESAQGMERNRRGLEYQVKDMQTKLDEAEQLAMKGGRKVVQRLEQRLRELEGQLDEEQRRLVDGQKNQRRLDRRIKELTFQQEEDHKNHERMQELVDKFQNKVIVHIFILEVL